MKNRFLFVLLICALVMGSFFSCATPGTQTGTQQNRSITIVNNTGYTIFYAYISETTLTTWGPDRLRSDQVIRNGESVSLELPNPRISRYDIRLVDSDRDEYIKMDVNTSTNNRIVFSFSDIRFPSLTIENNTGQTISEVFIANANDENVNIGANRLSSNLRNGESVTIQLSHFLGDVFLYNIMVVTSNYDIFFRESINARNDGRVVFSRNDFRGALDTLVTQP
jgi:hypothetical protein